LGKPFGFIKTKKNKKKQKTKSIPAAAGFLSLDASSGLLATASASAPAMFLALGSRLLWC